MVGGCIAGALLTHPNAGLWAVAGFTFLAVFERRISNLELVSIGVITAALILPWLILVVQDNGLTPFRNAMLTGSDEMWGGWRAFGNHQNFLNPGGFYGACGVVGISLLIDKRYLAPPLLLLMGLLFDHRGLFALHGVTLTAMAIAPLADLLITQGVGSVPAATPLTAASADTLPTASVTRYSGRWLFRLALTLPFLVSIGVVFHGHQHGPT